MIDCKRMVWQDQTGGLSGSEASHGGLRALDLAYLGVCGDLALGLQERMGVCGVL